jgi:hypothetical protein
MSTKDSSSQKGEKSPVQNEQTRWNMVFLNSTGLDDHKNTNNKKLIRSNAMLHFKRQERYRQNTATTIVRSANSINRTETTGWKSSTPYKKGEETFSETLYRDDYAMLLDNSLHTRSINPPDGLPTTAPRYALMFLHYCEYSFSLTV